MTTLLRAILASFLLAFAGAALAADAPAAKEAPATPAGEVKVGDTLYVCGCGPGCACDTAKAGPGKCHCGKDLVKAKVTKVENGSVTVDLGKGATQVIKTPYKCGCKDCKCNTAAFGPGKCHCGKDLVKT